MTAVAAVGLVGLGLLIGAFGTLIGAGGGFLLVPLLLLALLRLLRSFSRHPTDLWLRTAPSAAVG